MYISNVCEKQNEPQLTPEQQGLLNACRVDPENPLWVQPMVVFLEKLADEDRVAGAVQKFVNNNEIFRLRVDFRSGLRVWQASSRDIFTDIEFVDAGDVAPDELASEINWMLLDEAEYGFTLDGTWPVRVKVLRIGNDRWAVVFLFHRLVYHPGAKALYMEAFCAAVHQPAPSAAAPAAQPLSWSDYIRQVYGAMDIAAETATDTLAPVPAEAGNVVQDLACVNTTVEHLTGRDNLGLQDILLTGAVLWHHLFSRMGASEFMVDLPDGFGASVQKIIGPFSWQGAVSTAVTDDETIAALAEQVKQQLVASGKQAVVPHEFYNFDRQPARGSGARILYRYYDLDRFTCPDSEEQVIWSDTDILSTEWDLELIFKTSSSGTSLVMVYNHRLLGFEDAELWARELVSIISRMARGFDRPIAELRQALAAGRLAGPARPRLPEPDTQDPEDQAPCPSLGHLFSETAGRYPENIAVQTVTGTITYHDLEVLTGRIAPGIYRCAGRGGRIGILLDQGLHAVAAVLAVLKSGNAYVPLDIHMPGKRLQHMVDDADLSLVILDQQSEKVWQDLALQGPPCRRLDQFNDLHPDGSLIPPASGDDDAYIIYTSGTTGTPKGVLQSQRSVLHFVETYTRQLGITEDDSLTLMSAFLFDAAVLDIFTALLNGATLVVFDLKKEDFSTVLQRLQENRISIYHSTASVFRYFTESLDPTLRLPYIRYAVLGGEQVRRTDLGRFKTHFSPQATLVNLYGLSELTIGTMAFFSPDTDLNSDILPIGEPITSVAVTIFNEDNVPTPGAGQLVFASPCLAREYWRRPDLTSEKFMTGQDRFEGRFFLTGDIGEITAAGTLFHLGRGDFQIKIRGYRVEPEEIEACIATHDQISGCVVHPVSSTDEEPVLAAFIIPAPGAAGLAVDKLLAQYLKELLPDYMIPRLFLPVPAFPKTTSGKIDRQMLQKMAHEYLANSIN